MSAKQTQFPIFMYVGKWVYVGLSGSLKLVEMKGLGLPLVLLHKHSKLFQELSCKRGF